MHKSIGLFEADKLRSDYTFSSEREVKIRNAIEWTVDNQFSAALSAEQKAQLIREACRHALHARRRIGTKNPAT